MNIEEARKKKSELEKQISSLILKYHQETNTKVIDIKFSVQHPDKPYIYGDFDIQVEVRI